MKILTAFSAILVLATAGVSFGQTRPAYQQALDKMTKICGLSDEQVKKIKDIEETREKALVEVRAAFKANAAAMDEANKSGDVDKQSKAKEENARLTQQSKEASKKYDDDKLAVLTEQQKAKWADANSAERADMMSTLFTRAHDTMAKVCGLSDSQMKSIVSISVAAEEAVAQWRRDNADALNANQSAIEQATKDGDSDKLSALQAEAGKLCAPVPEFYRKSQQDIMAVLTGDQRAKWIEHTAPEMLFSQVGLFDLTDDQKSKVKDAAKPLAAETGATVEGVVKKLELKLFSDILTNEQKKKGLKETTVQTVQFNLSAANLTNDQESRIEGDYDQVVADKKNAPDIALAKDLSDTYKLAGDIAKKLYPLTQARLTDEQKKNAQKGMKSIDGAVIFIGARPKS